MSPAKDVRRRDTKITLNNFVILSEAKDLLFARAFGVQAMKELNHAQALRHQILHASRNHQRLRHTSQRRE
jgi:hypothetical protein